MTVSQQLVSKLLGSILSVTLLCGTTAAQEPSLGNNTQIGTPPTPQAAASRITVPEGFRVTLFAGEPDVQQPISLTTDERGRLWIAENYTYAENPTNFDTELRDRIVILEDTDGDGRHDQRKVFWDQGRKLASVEIGHGGVWVLCAPQLLFIPDRNRDDRPDGPPEVVLDGWDEGPVRHNIVNGLKWGPDGWLYGRHGIQATSEVGKPGAAPSQRVKLNCCIWRYHPTRKQFEVVCQGTTNPWGFDYDDHGQMFFINTVIGHLWHVIPGAHYRRMYGADFNPYLYQLIEQCADHFHWDTGEDWHETRHRLSDTTSQAGGGHAHSGLMVYLGDNWPDRFRNDLFTLNFHGRRINHDTLHRENAGYIAKHADDLLFANNEWFRGIDLIYGPDGGVFIADWADIGECHENDGVHRTSGRIYKVVYQQPAAASNLDLAALDDRQLAGLQLHENDWYVRQARRLLQERAAAGRDMSEAKSVLQEIFAENTAATRKLRALWCLNLIGATDESWLRNQLSHSDEHVRVWAIRLLVDRELLKAETKSQFADMALNDASGLVRLFLASAMQRLPLEDRWPIAEGLVAHSDDADDRSAPAMIWYGIEPAVPADPERAVALARRSAIPMIRQHIVRRLASDLAANADAVEQLLQAAGNSGDQHYQLDTLKGLAAALQGMRKVAMPEAWDEAAAAFSRSSSSELAQLSLQLGVVFGDGLAITELQELVRNKDADSESRRQAIRSLVEDRSPETLALLKEMLTDRALDGEVVRAFAAFDAPEIADLIIDRYSALDPDGKLLAIDTLTTRPAFAEKLLSAVATGQIDRTAVSAYHARQLRSFQNASITEELEKWWGTSRETSAEKKQRIEQLRVMLDQPGDASQGRLLFESTCSSCHVLYGKGTHVGPDLTGANRQNLTYLLENIVDPSASVATDFHVSAVHLADGRILTGVVLSEEPQTITVQTQKDRLVLSREEVDKIVPQEVSLMPDGLLQQFTESQIVDLFAYLMTRSQVPPAQSR